METGYDILFFWVARMIMLGLGMTGQVPFDTVYLHGLIRNDEGKKISKSLPDAWRYDPLNIIDEYGQDALRFSLVTGSTPGNDTKLALSRVEANRNFANKIWQATRFVLGNLGSRAAEFMPPADALAMTTGMDEADRWILSRYHRLVGEVQRLIDAYQFGEAGRQIYDFLWGEYCDWYIEMTKMRLKGGDSAEGDAARRTLVYVLEGCLRLLHPYMPFVTEALWQYLPHHGEALIVAPWPAAGALADECEARMASLMELVRAIRNARSEYEVEPGRLITALVAAGDQTAFLKSQEAVLLALARIDPQHLTIAPRLEHKPDKALALVVGAYECYLPLAALVDLERERARLGTELGRIRGEIARSEKLLGNPGFTGKAPEAVVQKERDKLSDHREREAKLRERLANLG